MKKIYLKNFLNIMFWIIAIAALSGSYAFEINLDNITSDQKYYLFENTVVNFKCNSTKYYNLNCTTQICNNSFKLEYCLNLRKYSDELFYGNSLNNVEINSTFLVLYFINNKCSNDKNNNILRFYIKDSITIDLNNITKTKYYLPENTTVYLKCSGNTTYYNRQDCNTSICNESFKLEYCNIPFYKEKVLCYYSKTFYKYPNQMTRYNLTTLYVYIKNKTCIPNSKHELFFHINKSLKDKNKKISTTIIPAYSTTLDLPYIKTTKIPEIYHQLQEAKNCGLI